MQRQLTAAFIGLSIALAMPAMAHEDHSAAAEYSLTTVRNNIAMVAGLGGNIAVLSGEQGLVLVDDGYNNKAEQLHQALAPLGGESKLAYIINTHFHGDHSEGNLHLGKYAAIIAHDNVLQRLSSEQEVSFFKMKAQAYPLIAKPSLTFANSMNLHFNGEQLHVVHYPNGHTDGDAVIFFRNNNVVHMGDHYFKGIFPFVDTTNGGNVVQYANNVEAILAQIDDDTLVIPGHGSLSNKAELTAYYNMLRGTIAEVSAMKSKGYSLETMQQKGLSTQWQSWAKGFIPPAAWIEFIYTSL